MSWKFGLIFALLSIVNAIEVQHHHHHEALLKTPILVKHVEYADSVPEYEFAYSVHDEHTGDIKSQKESRKGDKVEGSYELIDSDGHRRLVHYTADDHNGFQATVHREPTDIKIPIPEHKEIIHHHKKIIATPLVHYTPVHKVIAQPIHHHHHVIAAAPVKLIHETYHHEGDNHVSFSGPHHAYKY